MKNLNLAVRIKKLFDSRPWLVPFFLVGLILCVVIYSAGPAWLEVHFMDAGYGNAVLIRFPDRSNMLIDAGEAQYTERILNYLLSLNIKRIDAVIITHPHQNHFGALQSIAESIPIRRVYTNGDTRAEEGYAELLQMFRQKKIRVDVLKKGSVVREVPRGIRLEVLSPEKLDSSVNDDSLVIGLKYKRKKFLFFADIEARRQKEMLNQASWIKDADCVLLPHHGGELQDDFWRLIARAPFLIMSTGENEWGRPSQKTLRKLKGKKLFRTDQNGTIIVRTNGISMRVEAKKQ